MAQESKHLHQPECYRSTVQCRLPEHQHSGNCWEGVDLICRKQPHTHEPTCTYDRKICGYP